MIKNVSWTQHWTFAPKIICFTDGDNDQSSQTFKNFFTLNNSFYSNQVHALASQYFHDVTMKKIGFEMALLIIVFMNVQQRANAVKNEEINNINNLGLKGDDVQKQVSHNSDPRLIQSRLSQRRKNYDNDNEAMPKAVVIVIIVTISLFSCIIIVAIIVLIQDRFDGEQDRLLRISRYENEAERRCHCGKRRSELERAAIIQPGIDVVRHNQSRTMIMPITRGSRVLAPFKFNDKPADLKEEDAIEPPQHVTDQEKVFP